jgi:hypothetical protein
VEATIVYLVLSTVFRLNLIFSFINILVLSLKSKWSGTHLIVIMIAITDSYQQKKGISESMDSDEFLGVVYVFSLKLIEA